MKAIIIHSLSKHKRSLKIANTLEGDKFIIEHLKKPISCFLLQMLVYGFTTVLNKEVKIKEMDIDLDKYNEIYLVSPVWAGKPSAFMKQFLINHPLKNKKIHLIGSCDGGYKTYFDSFKNILDESNEIIEKTMYIKGIKH
ncbi:MAG: hypothetical protein KAH13_03030 [Tenericutes bacterium]|nr:hypothetical protein [Mycoplasmatota bacterium]